jgi:hypothetical protein
MKRGRGDYYTKELILKRYKYDEMRPDKSISL